MRTVVGAVSNIYFQKQRNHNITKKLSLSHICYEIKVTVIRFIYIQKGV
jgi:hypothetical protein